MKICIISTWPPTPGGVAAYTKRITSALNSLPTKSKPTITVFADKLGDHSIAEEKEEIPGVEIKRIWSRDALYLIKIIRKIVGEHFDIVHIQHEYILYGRLLSFLSFPLLVLLMRILQGRVVVQLHSVIPRRLIDFDFLSTNNISEKRSLVPLFKISVFIVTFLTCKFSNVVIVHADYLRKSLIQDYFASSKKVRILRYGLAKPEREYSSPQLPKGRTVHNILFYGYLSGRKGVDLLLRAFAQLAAKRGDIRLIVAGGNSPHTRTDILSEMKQLAQELRIEQDVYFTGEKGAVEMEPLFEGADVLVLPYKYSVSASDVISKACRYCVPIIASDIGVLKEEIQHGRTGLLFRAGSIEELKNAISSLLDNRRIQHTIRTNLYDYARERSWHNTSLRLLEIYKENATTH